MFAQRCDQQKFACRCDYAKTGKPQILQQAHRIDRAIAQRGEILTDIVGDFLIGDRHDQNEGNNNCLRKK